MNKGKVLEETVKIVNTLKEQGKMSFVPATTEEKIAVFEKENAVALPLKYKEWLMFSDGGELFLPAGVQLYGTEHKPIIDVNDDGRPNDNYVVIGSLASGDSILFEKHYETIAIYNQAAGWIEDDEIYPDFAEFLKSLFDLLGVKESD